jgi:hypothetical protein
MTDLERELMSAFGWLLYPIPLPPLVLSLVAAWTTTTGAFRYRRHGVPAGGFRSTFAVLVLMLDAFVVLFAGAFSWSWALWQVIWLAGPALVTAAALFEIQRQRAAHSPPPAYWDGC